MHTRARTHPPPTHPHTHSHTRACAHTHARTHDSIRFLCLSFLSAEFWLKSAHSLKCQAEPALGKIQSKVASPTINLFFGDVFSRGSFGILGRSSVTRPFYLSFSRGNGRENICSLFAIPFILARLMWRPSPRYSRYRFTSRIRIIVAVLRKLAGKQPTEIKGHYRLLLFRAYI